MGTEADSLGLHAAFRRMLEMVRWRDARLYAVVSDVSGWSPAQHLEHMARVAHTILDRIAKLEEGATQDGADDGPTPGDVTRDIVVRRRGAPTLAGRAVLLGARIPRGRAEAPRGTGPAAVPARAALVESVESAAARIADTAARATGLKRVAGVCRHPLLGWFRAAQWWRFLRIHTDHHVAIIDDIDRHDVLLDPLADPAAPVADTP